MALFKPKLYQLEVWHDNKYHLVFTVNRREIIQLRLMLFWLRKIKPTIGEAKITVWTLNGGYKDELYQEYKYESFHKMYKHLCRRLAEIVVECEKEKEVMKRIET